jgi:hypothetical protein
LPFVDIATAAGVAPVACSGVADAVSVDGVGAGVVVDGGFEPHAADSKMAARRFFFMQPCVPTLDELA